MHRPSYYSNSALLKENEARQAADIASRRISKVRTNRKGNLMKKESSKRKTNCVDYVERTKKRLKEYKLAEMKRKRNASVYRTTSACRYTSEVAGHLARSRRKQLKEVEIKLQNAKEERRELITKRLEATSNYVASVLKGRFGTFEHGSYKLRNGPNFKPWRPKKFWLYGYSNPILTSHDGPRLSNHRLFSTKLIHNYQLLFAGAHKKKLYHGGPRWRLATKAVLSHLRQKQVRDTRAYLHFSDRHLLNDDRTSPSLPIRNTQNDDYATNQNSDNSNRSFGEEHASAKKSSMKDPPLYLS
uniref:Uncharacterized protein n=1 Tax=Aureoumbra lagunensis TaxID=44058 RepID=A0A7S3NIB1_9STRA|mmetsp:Transcript_6408/g.9564  ORF Transcript_6408/g.9564 Transcript_6408/m.9564 type:complete len:300 (-) Transcript_6408:311-1210(-)